MPRFDALITVGLAPYAAIIQKIPHEDESEEHYQPPFEYASVLGGLMYLANLTRPDIVTSVNRLARYVTNPSKSHFTAVKRVVAYLFHSRDRGLRYTKESVDNNPYRLYAASDASFADCRDTKRSTTGRCLWMGKKVSGLIDWKS